MPGDGRSGLRHCHPERGGVYVEMANGMTSPVFADEGLAIAWFAWVRAGARVSFHDFCHPGETLLGPAPAPKKRACSTPDLFSSPSATPTHQQGPADHG